MNLLERVLTLLRANLNAVVEKADDPEKVLEQLRLDLRNQLVQVKTQVATAIAEGHRLRKRSQEKRAEMDTWLKKAEQAIQQGNDDVARRALISYDNLKKQVERYHQSQKEQEQFVSTMRSALQQLEAKLAEIETTLDLLAARKRQALIQQRVIEALNKSTTSAEKEHVNKARDAILDAEARAQALADLHARDLNTQLDQLSEEQLIEQQLNDLKAKKGITTTQPLLYEGQEQSSPLLSPQPESSEPSRKRTKDQSRPQTEPLPSTTTADNLARLQQLLDSLQNPSSKD
jgi:phage shock protein A